MRCYGEVCHSQLVWLLLRLSTILILCSRESMITNMRASIAQTPGRGARSLCRSICIRGSLVRGEDLSIQWSGRISYWVGFTAVIVCVWSGYNWVMLYHTTSMSILYRASVTLALRRITYRSARDTSWDTCMDRRTFRIWLCDLCAGVAH